jgi:sugar phosphate isomerase/epimerase
VRLGIFAKTFEGNSPGEVLPAATAAGFSAVQYNMACSGLPPMPDHIPSSVAQEVGEFAAKSGISIAALSGTYNMIHPDPAIRSKGHDRLAKLAAAARTMKTNLITLCTGSRDPDDQWRDHRENRRSAAWKDLLASMEVAIGIADKYDIYLGIEPELANVINSAPSARRLLDELKSPRLKIILDPANLFETATQKEQRLLVAQAVDLLADSIVMGHAKDRSITGGFTAAGRGVLDYPHYLACMRRIRFDGTIVTHGLSASDANEVASFLGTQLETAGFIVEHACPKQ